jgi:hypothetical protein
MDESLLKAVSQHMNVPETLISRSASARAEANGSSTDDVLRAWLGGEAVQVLETKPTIPEEEPTKVAVEAILEKKTEQVEEGALVEVLEKPYIKEESQILTQELVPPVGLIIKLYKSLKIGFIFGLSCGLTQAFIIGNTFFFGVYLDPDNTIVISEYSKIQFVLTISLTTALFSIFNTIISKKTLDASSDGFGIETNDKESLFLGIGLGLAFGTLYALAITNDIGTVVEGVLEGDSTLNYIPVFGALLRISIYSVIAQIFVTAIGQAFGIPKGLGEEERDEVIKIRNRINGSVILPLSAIFGSGAVAFLISRIFLNFHSYAPLLAIIISAAILLFAGLISSAPNIKVTKTEIWISLLGMLILIVVTSSIAYVQR